MSGWASPLPGLSLCSSGWHPSASGCLLLNTWGQERWGETRRADGTEKRGCLVSVSAADGSQASALARPPMSLILLAHPYPLTLPGHTVLFTVIQHTAPSRALLIHTLIYILFPLQFSPVMPIPHPLQMPSQEPTLSSALQGQYQSD